MEASIPAAAALLLDLIGKTETGKAGREGYDVIYANKQGTLAKPITSMTLGEVVTAQVQWALANKSSAAGRYQFIRSTLEGLITELDLERSSLFSPDLQDVLGFQLLKRRGWDRFLKGSLSIDQFGLALAKEWASFPVLSTVKGANRPVDRGQSYYAGDGLNKSLIRPETVEGLLRRAAVKPMPPSIAVGEVIDPIILPPPSPPLNPTQGDYQMEVDVKSSWLSKINWTVAIGILTSLLAFVGIDVPADVQTALQVFIGNVTLVIVWIQRTWFTKTITTASAKKL